MGKVNVFMLGQNGFIGRTVKSILDKRFNLSFEEKCDVLVNCAGFSKMFEGNSDPEKMIRIENSIMEKIGNIKFDKIIHLSTIYLELYDNIYCDIKRGIEEKILNLYPKSIILRLGGVVGKGLKKNVVFDILNNKALFVTNDSLFNYISSEEVGGIISYLIENDLYSGIINTGASYSISVEDIAKILNASPQYGEKKESVVFDTKYLNSFYKTMGSDEYIKLFFEQIYK